MKLFCKFLELKIFRKKLRYSCKCNNRCKLWKSTKLEIFLILYDLKFTRVWKFYYKQKSARVNIFKANTTHRAWWFQRMLAKHKIILSWPYTGTLNGNGSNSIWLMTKGCDIKKIQILKKILSKLYKEGVPTLKNWFLFEIGHLNQIQSGLQSSKMSE